jgi:hypothetical protein
VKIFGIGLSRTGTYSLNNALTLLGYRAKHFPRIEEEILGGDYRLGSTSGYDALTDTPVAPIFAQLDTAHPGSKFILTVRALDDWLDACARYFPWQDRHVLGSDFARVVMFQRLYVYGCRAFDRGRWAYVYETHQRNVEHYFRTRPNDLLIMNITAGDGWNALCPFLGKPIPPRPFPHDNAFRALEEVERSASVERAPPALSAP